MSKGISPAVDALRGCHPNTRITLRLGGQRFGTQVDARTIVKDFDDLVANREHWKAEAAKWEGVAQRLAMKVGA